MTDDNAIGDSFFDVSGLPGEEVEDGDPLVGTVLDGRYRLDRLLGEGGMGRVYAGTQLSVEREVAIKLLRGEALAQQEVKERFLREAKVISGFSHPNIVRLIDYGQDAQRRFPYLVMELVRGVSLGELTRRGRLALPLALEIAYQVCGALVQAHSAGIVHRDLKPENLQLVPVVGDSFQAKVLDFGIAFPKESATRITATGMICGTAYYVAPEQARAQELDGRADLYALGIILYEMLSGHLPFRANSDFQILLMQVQQEPPPLSDYLPPEEVPEDVIKLVHDLMAKSPDDRPPSARAVRERIEVIRNRCAIAPLRLDLEEASADAFERWILPPATNAPVMDAETAYDSSTPPEVRQKLDEARQDAEPPADTVEEPGPDESQTAPSQKAAGPTTQSPASKSSAAKIVAGLAVAIVALGAVLAYLLTREPPQTPSDEASSDRTVAAADKHDADDPAAAKGGAKQPTAVAQVPLSAYAGRCMVIGDSDTWFHTVFLYPEVGELMLQGDQRLMWSPVEVVAHQGRRVELSFEPPDAKKPERFEARPSGDRLIFKWADGDKFVCRKHEVQKYYDTLATAGTFVDEDDEQAELVVPTSGQHFEMGGAEYVYRILSGADIAKGHILAVRPADDKAATWKRWTVAYDPKDEAVEVVREDKARRFVSAEALADKARRAAKRRHKRAARKSKPEPDPKPAEAAKAEAAPTKAPPAQPMPAYLTPASKEVYRKYEKLVEDAADRCADAIAERNEQVAHHQKLIDQKRYDEAKQYREDVLSNTAAYSEKIQAAAYAYSNALQRASRAGLIGSQVQKLSKIWQKRCQ